MKTVVASKSTASGIEDPGWFHSPWPLHLFITGIAILGHALVALINAVIVWQSIYWIGRTGGFIMPAMQMPQVIAQVSIPIGCGLAIVYCLIKIALLASGRESRNAPQTSDRVIEDPMEM